MNRNIKTRTKSRRLAFDTLESRTLLDGNVTARLVHGDLIVRGDELDNRITIDHHRLGPGEVRVTVDISATLNGSSGPEIFSGVTGNVRVRLFDGNDRLNISGVDIADALVIDAGRGDDIVLVAHGRIDGELTIDGRLGNDSINLVDLVVEDEARVDAGAGDNIIVLDDSTFQDDVSLRARGGNDSVFLNSNFEESRSVRVGAGRNLITSEAASANFDFRAGAQGWVAGFADYRAGDEEFNELEAGIRPLPAELDSEGTGFFIRGVNHSDDLFMFLKRQLGPEHGLEPDTTYQVRFELVFASNAPSGCAGIGGPPGEAVWMKAGASVTEPRGVTDADGTVQMNVDKGNQSSGGRAASVVNNIANGIPCDEVPPEEEPPPPDDGGPIVIQTPEGPGQGYVSIQRTHVHEFLVRTDSAGRLWLLVGTDSGFEGPTALFYQRIDVKLTPVTDPRRAESQRVAESGLETGRKPNGEGE